MKWGAAILSVLLFVVGGFVVFGAFIMSIDEPGYDGVFKVGLYMMAGAVMGFIASILWPSNKK